MTSPARLLCTVTAIGLLAAGLTSTAVSARTAPPAITITGTLPQLPAHSATVLIEVEQQADRNAHGVAQRLIDTPVARQTVTSATFSVAVPASSTLTRAEINGEATFVVLAYSGDYSTVQERSAPMTRQAAQGNMAAMAAAAGHTLALSRFNSWQSMPASQREMLPRAQGAIPPPPPCLWHRYGREREGLTRISQLHLANVSGLQAHWRYSTTADTTMSVGFSNSPASGYAAVARSPRPTPWGLTAASPGGQAPAATSWGKRTGSAIRPVVGRPAVTGTRTPWTTWWAPQGWASVGQRPTPTADA